MNDKRVIEPVIDAVRALRQLGPDEYLKIEPPYPRGYCFRIRYGSGNRETGNMTCHAALLRKETPNDPGHTIWSQTDISCNDLTSLAVMLKHALRELDTCWTPEDLQTAFLTLQNIPVDMETERIGYDFLHFSWGVPYSEVCNWLGKRYPGGLLALYEWYDERHFGLKKYPGCMGNAIRNMDDRNLAEFLFGISSKNLFSSVDEAMRFIQTPAGDLL